MKITGKDDPRKPVPDQKDKPLYTPEDQKPKQPGFDEKDTSQDKRHPHQEGPMPSG